MGPFVHPSSPFHIGFADKFFQVMIRGENLLAVVRQSNERSIEVVEQERAFLEPTVQQRLQCSRRIREVGSQPYPDLRLCLLPSGDRGTAFHRARTDHPPDGLACGELSPLADFAFEFGVRRGALLVLVVAHRTALWQAKVSAPIGPADMSPSKASRAKALRA